MFDLIHLWASQWEVLHMYALIGANDHSGEPQHWKKVATVFRKKKKKRKEERKFNIFSSNYSVGTVLCKVKCPGSGMAWWVNIGAKPHPPHIVLSMDFLHFAVPIWNLCPSSNPLSWAVHGSASALVTPLPRVKHPEVFNAHLLTSNRLPMISHPSVDAEKNIRLWMDFLPLSGRISSMCPWLYIM